LDKSRRDSDISDWLQKLSVMIETLQSILDKAWEVLETCAKLQKQWDLAREVTISADPSIDAILA